MDAGEYSLDEARAAARNSAMAQARMLRAIADFAAVRDDERSAVAEVALELSISEHAAAGNVRLARALTTRLPNTLAALDAGEIDAYKASKVADVTEVLSDDLAIAADAQLVGRLANRTATDIRRIASRIVQRVDPDGAAGRAAARRETRRVEIRHEPDAMATMVATLPAETASAIYTRLDDTAHRLRHGGDPRTLEQLRADVLAELCLSGNGAAGQPRADIQVHVTLDTLTGASTEPGELAGHGTVPATIAREIAHRPNSTWRRILTDPVTRQITDVGRTRYRPPAALADLVKTRDRECRFPGCHRPAVRSDLDHSREWQHGGATSKANLGAYCGRHHTLKEHPGWSYHLHPDGTATVRTPTGRRYTSYPSGLIEQPDSSNNADRRAATAFTSCGRAGAASGSTRRP